MKKILMFRTAPFDANIRGYNVQEMGLSKAFCRLGYNVDWVAFKSSDYNSFVFYKYNDCSAKCIEVPRIRLFRWGINLRYAKKEFLEQYDIVVCFEQMQIMTWLVSRNIDKGILYSGPYYNLFTIKFVEPIYDKISFRSISKSFVGNYSKSVLAQQYLEKKGYKNVHTVGVGLDTERFDTDVSIQPETKKIMDYMNTNKCILYVGALSERKNYPFLLQVYEEVLKLDQEVKLVVIGKSVTPTIYKLLGKKGRFFADKCERKLSLRARKGLVTYERIDNDQLRYIYPLAKAFLLPSKLEIFGMVLLEAMYLGAPVISSYNGGSATVIENKGTGIISKEFDAKEWALAIMKFIADPIYTKTVTNRAHNLIKNVYNWDNIAKKMLNGIDTNNAY